MTPGEAGNPGTGEPRARKTGALDGIRVLEFTALIAGPHAPVISPTTAPR